MPPVTAKGAAAGGTHEGPLEAGVDRVGETAAKPGGLAEPAGEPGNAVLAGNARVVRWAGPAFMLLSLILLPWTIVLAYWLPSREVSPNYAAAWAGFDGILLMALAGTGYFALRRSRYLAMAATATATLLIVDAWFDVMTSPPGQRLRAIVLAVLVELPLAAVCAWLSHRAQQLAERRIVLLLRRGTKSGPRKARARP